LRRDPNAPQYVPLGDFITIDGLDLYVSRPLIPGSKAVIWSHDIYGWKEGHTIELVDRLASETEYTVNAITVAVIRLT